VRTPGDNQREKYDENVVCGKFRSRQGRYRKRWLADVESNLRYVAVRRWRMKAFLRKEQTVIVKRGQCPSWTKIPSGKL
jgi:hypothetical protein